MRGNSSSWAGGGGGVGASVLIFVCLVVLLMLLLSHSTLTSVGLEDDSPFSIISTSRGLRAVGYKGAGCEELWAGEISAGFVNV